MYARCDLVTAFTSIRLENAVLAACVGADRAGEWHQRNAGLNAAMLALAMGATRILGTGRNKALLDRVKALSPQRIEVYAIIAAISSPSPVANHTEPNRLIPSGHQPEGIQGQRFHLSTDVAARPPTNGRMRHQQSLH
jgi:hypothetical protein